jgi:hypothetical protein
VKRFDIERKVLTLGKNADVEGNVLGQQKPKTGA